MIIRRRALLTGATATTLAALLRASVAHAQAPAGPFTVPPLPYGYDANEPSIDTMTMQLHHDRHHAAYVANLNAAVHDYPSVAAMKIPDMLARLDSVPERVRTAVRNNAGGHANHSMFWQVMGGKGGPPTGAVATAIGRDLGGFDALKTTFERTGTGVFGAGWVFVTVTPGGVLGLAARPNQDTPLLEGGRVLFGNDVWEHAYYLKYQNRRADYLHAWWDVLNWDSINQRYEAAMKGTLDV